MYNTLTNSQKLISKFVLENPRLIAVNTAKQIGELTNTSETSVIRFCYALGLSGYSELQKEIRNFLLLSQDKEDPLKKFRESTGELDQDEDLLNAVIEQEKVHIEKTLQGLSQEVYLKSIDSILKAKKIVIVGFRTSYAPAYWLSISLNIIKGNCILYRGGIDDANYLISEMKNDWLVIALSLPRYVEETLSFVKAAQSQDVPILAITDDELSPIGTYADLLLKVTAPKPTALKGMSTIFALLSAMVTGVAAADKERVKQRVDRYENTSVEFNPFVQLDED
jgi:DNA-binding MurR/RpiR family transcriptional regulator